jgi:nucleoside-diphosphate-sugar epimerase
MKILMTGGTGFLGQYLVRELAAVHEKIFITGRNSEKPSTFKDLKNVEYIRADLTDPQLTDTLDGDILNVDLIIHAAALYDIKSSYDKVFLQNVFATQNMLGLAKKCKNLKAFYYVSTIAVGDDNSFYLEEDFLPNRKNFNDHYSMTKYLAEKLVRDNCSKIPMRILRPGIIVGDSLTGHMPKSDGPYYFMDALKKHSLLIKPLSYLPLPYNPNTKLPIIPVDHCARFISKLIERDLFELDLKTYHLISSELPTVQEFLYDINRVLDLRVEYLPVGKNPIHNVVLKMLGIPTELIAFMFSKLSYDKTRTNKELPELEESRYSDYKEKLFHYLA